MWTSWPCVQHTGSSGHPVSFSKDKTGTELGNERGRLEFGQKLSSALKSGGAQLSFKDRSASPLGPCGGGALSIASGLWILLILLPQNHPDWQIINAVGKQNLSKCSILRERNHEITYLFCSLPYPQWFKQCMHCAWYVLQQIFEWMNEWMSEWMGQSIFRRTGIEDIA